MSYDNAEDVAPALGFDQPIRAVVLGARDGIGATLSEYLLSMPSVARVLRTSRDRGWVDGPAGVSHESRRFLDLTNDVSVEALAEHLADWEAPPNLIINCTGLLHDGDMQPERAIKQLDRAHMRRAFDVNATGVAMLIRHLLPILPRAERAVFASLSARVGSISDNRLGGWFSYRASKAAQNMILKTASIEAARRWPKLIVLALHPGTVDTELSKPFSRRVPEHKLFTTDVAARHLCRVIAQRSPSDSGGFFAWDGSPVEW